MPQHSASASRPGDADMESSVLAPGTSAPGPHSLVCSRCGLARPGLHVLAVRILLVSGLTAMREALAAALAQSGGLEVVGQASSLDEARQQLHDVDVAVLDLRLPDGSGADLIEELRRHNPAAQALLLSASADRGEIADAVRLGAAAVFLESVPLEAVLHGVRRLAAGEALLPPEEVIELLRISGRRLEREHRARLALDRLTPREREVLQASADGLDSRSIAARLGITIRTQRNHMTNIEAKLGVHSQVQALTFALRYGVVRVRECALDLPDGA